MKKMALLLMLCGALIGSDCEAERVADLDEGFRQIGELVIHPEVLPMGVAWDESFEHEGLEAVPPAVVAWWNDQIGEEFFYEDPFSPDITTEVNFISLDEMPDNFFAIEHQADLAEVEYSVADGAVISCRCVLNVDLAYDVATMEQALRHCYGHCLGLEDDPFSVDLRSIMSNPLDPLGELTAGDRELLL